MTPHTEAAAFLRALGFLTRLPVPALPHGDMAAALRYLPAAGALIGSFAAATLALAATVLPVAPAVLLDGPAELHLLPHRGGPELVGGERGWVVAERRDQGRGRPQVAEHGVEQVGVAHRRSSHWTTNAAPRPA